MTEARTQETLSADLAEEARLTRQRDDARHHAVVCERTAAHNTANAAVHRAVEADLTVKLRAVQSRLYGEGM